MAFSDPRSTSSRTIVAPLELSAARSGLKWFKEALRRRYSRAGIQKSDGDPFPFHGNDNRQLADGTPLHRPKTILRQIQEGLQQTVPLGKNHRDLSRQNPVHNSVNLTPVRLNHYAQIVQNLLQTDLFQR